MGSEYIYFSLQFLSYFETCVYDGRCMKKSCFCRTYCERVCWAQRDDEELGQPALVEFTEYLWPRMETSKPMTLNKELIILITATKSNLNATCIVLVDTIWG
jgi:hypothetical protein